MYFFPDTGTVIDPDQKNTIAGTEAYCIHLTYFFFSAQFFRVFFFCLGGIWKNHIYLFENWV